MKERKYNQYGFCERDINEMNRIFTSYPTLQKVILFGSRAKGNFRKGSDIDLAIITDDNSRKTVSYIHDDLEEDTMIPYFFDVVDKNKISSTSLQEHIKICGKEIYSQ